MTYTTNFFDENRSKIKHSSSCWGQDKLPKHNIKFRKFKNGLPPNAINARVNPKDNVFRPTENALAAYDRSNDPYYSECEFTDNGRWKHRFFVCGKDNNGGVYHVQSKNEVEDGQRPKSDILNFTSECKYALDLTSSYGTIKKKYYPVMNIIEKIQPVTAYKMWWDDSQEDNAERRIQCTVYFDKSANKRDINLTKELLEEMCENPDADVSDSAIRHRQLS